MDIVTCTSKIIGIHEKYVESHLFDHCISIDGYEQFLVEVGGIDGGGRGRGQVEDVIHRDEEVPLEERKNHKVGCVERYGYLHANGFGSVPVSLPKSITVLLIIKSTGMTR